MKIHIHPAPQAFRQKLDAPKIGAKRDRTGITVSQQAFARHDMGGIAQIGAGRHTLQRGRFVAPQRKRMASRSRGSKAQTFQVIQPRPDPKRMQMWQVAHREAM